MAFRDERGNKARKQTRRFSAKGGGPRSSTGVVQQVEGPMTMNTERRKFVAGVGAAAAATAVLAGGQALAQGNQQIGAKAMPYQAKPMPFDPKSITGISEKVLVSHCPARASRPSQRVSDYGGSKTAGLPTKSTQRRTRSRLTQSIQRLRWQHSEQPATGSQRRQGRQRKLKSFRVGNFRFNVQFKN